MATTIATEVTKEQTEQLKAEAKGLKVVFERLRNEHGNATAHYQGLLVEQAALPQTKHASILSGDVSAYSTVMERERTIVPELTLSEVAMARARVRYLEAAALWSKAFRDFAREEASRLNGPTMDRPEGNQKAIDASNLYEGSRSTVMEMSGALAEAQRSLDDVTRRAQLRLR